MSRTPNADKASRVVSFNPWAILLIGPMAVETTLRTQRVMAKLSLEVTSDFATHLSNTLALAAEAVAAPAKSTRGQEFAAADAARELFTSYVDLGRHLLDHGQEARHEITAAWQRLPTEISDTTKPVHLH
jgi:hypothetical protein